MMPPSTTIKQVTPHAIVWKMAEKLSDPIIFRDHEGNIRSYRYYSWLGRMGITDIKGERVVFSARYNNVEIDTQSEVIIAGDDGIGWRIFPLPGSTIGHAICTSGVMPNFFRRLESAKRWLVPETKY